MILFLVAALCPAAHASSDKKLSFLVKFYDLNEAAFAYHRHCISTTAPINPEFLKNLEFVADELFTESKKTSPGMSDEYIRNRILERRYSIQYRLDNANIHTGCSSPDTTVAKKHYEEFSRFNTAQVSKFIDDKTAQK